MVKKAFWILFASWVVIAQDEGLKTEVLQEFDDGVTIYGRFVDEEEISQLNFNKISSLNYYVLDEMSFRVSGEWVYIDEALLFEHQIVAVVSPLVNEGSSLAVSPDNFIELFWKYPFATNKTADVYFSVMSDNMPFPQRLINPHECNSGSHNEVAPHYVDTAEGERVCHGTVGSSGKCFGTVGELGYYLLCKTWTSGSGMEERSLCRATIKCQNGFEGLIDDGPGRASELSCSTVTTGGNQVFIGQFDLQESRDKGYMICGNQKVEFDCTH